MTNAERFKSIFGIYATELWAMSEPEFLEWLNVENEPTQTNASNALNALDCVDTISRKAAVEEVHKYFMSELDKEETHGRDGWEVYTNIPHVNELLTHNQQISKKIKALPSAERRGKWIEVDYYRAEAKCSECGASTWEMFAYCPHCGARMEMNR